MAAFHEGEIALQAQAGVDKRLAEVGSRVIRDHMPDQHREFFAQLPFVVLGSLDESGQPWASVLAGAPGFAHSPQPRRLRIAGGQGLRAGASIGLLGIEAHTRRRNRMNGVVDTVDEHGLEIAVRQSFGNCPKYIQPREASFVPDAPPPGPVRTMDTLDEEALQLVRASDTFFIATSHPAAAADGVAAHGVDVSHRGGPPGFVAAAPGELRVADYPGNNYFNTLGNLLLQPRCGLLFIDYASGTTLHIAARGQVERTPGARELVLQVEKARYTPHALPLRWR
ncbi:pyridoxamine 5'-phosphate oxidase family protein [Ramlibacter albus]|uniref:Pyridoxamine 5'-phosphate oxidase family protein n=1 Tax=Ramlibacter albus TaxID=2079448 RepID=A0A923M3H3_9BURK|nr:pyridoxamine 5'-phosphate oxidase family protein [Ramlibacter albus]MBC5763233.1 pyridoxamine 5'-phosphate oxidase family protein [Ramlibacter albus]